jgi:23S rRNA pseudouridine2604 synthase
MSKGVPVLGVMTKKCKVVKETPLIFKITLIQGLNRQIRRMCEAVGVVLLELERIRFGPLTLQDVALGSYRKLTPNEVESLQRGIPLIKA